MKRPTAPRILLCITVFAFAARMGVAQLIQRFNPGETAVITMKSGEKIEGKVLGDAPDSVEIEYRLTPKIKDKKVLLKSEIASVKKLRPSETEFTELGLARLLPSPDVKDASYYESTIQDKLRTFVAKYPGTPESAEVEKIITALGEEKSKVMSGQLKVEGRWLDAASVKRDSYNIDAYPQLLNMREKAAENKDTRYLEALRAFEQLRTEHGVSPYFLKAIPEALDYLKKFEEKLADMIKEAPILLKNRTDGLKQLPANEAPAARKAIEEEDRAYKEAIEKQSRAKPRVKWHDISKFDVKGLQDIAVVIVKERAELGALDVPALQADSDALITVIRSIADKNITEASVALNKAQKIRNPLYAPLIKSLSHELDVLKKNADKEKKAAAAPATAAAAPTAENKVSGNPYAEILKKQEEEKKKAAEAKKAAAVSAKTGDSSADTYSEPAQSSFSLMAALNEYGIYLGGGLIVIILIAWFIGKRKKKEEEA